MSSPGSRATRNPMKAIKHVSIGRCVSTCRVRQARVGGLGLEVRQDSHVRDAMRLDEGERAAILLATQIGADLLLIDDRDGVNVARSKGFAVTGTLGILDLAATRGLIRLNEAVEHLKNTSFRYPRMCWTPCWLGIPRKESREIDGGRRHKVGWGKFATGISCEIVQWRA